MATEAPAAVDKRALLKRELLKRKLQEAQAAHSAPPPEERGFIQGAVDWLFPGRGSSESALGALHASSGRGKQLAEQARTGQPIQWSGQATAHDPLMLSIGPGNLGRPPVPPARAAAPAAQSQAAQLVDDFNQLGITPRLGAVSQSRSIGALQQGLKEVPVVGDMAVRSSQRTVRETGEATQRIAEGIGEVKPQLSTGRGVQQGLERFSKETVPTRSEELYNKYWGHYGEGEAVDMTETVNALSKPSKRFDNAELGAEFVDPTLAKWADIIKRSDPLGIGTPGKALTINDARAFRSEIGPLLKSKYGPKDINQQQLWRAYNALTDDLRASAAAKGPQALKDFDNADKYWSAARKRMDTVADLVSTRDKPVAPESVYNDLVRMAQAKGSTADFRKLSQVRMSMPDTEWNDFVATFTSTLGKRAPDGPFSPTVLVSQWRALSPQARNIMYGGTGMARWAKDMDRLVRVAEAQANVEKLANFSGTTRTATVIGSTAALLSHPIPTILTGLTAAGAERLIMSPTFVRWLYSTPRTPKAYKLHLEGLKEQGKRPDTGEAAMRLLFWLQNQPVEDDGGQN